MTEQIRWLGRAMGIPAETIRDHIAYTNWATKRLLAAVEALSPEERARDFGTADRSVGGTLTHLYRAERSWFARVLHGTPRTPNREPEDEELGTLLADWPALGVQWKSWADGLTDGDADRVLEYTDMKGKAWSNALGHIVLHVVNHATHHRGQVSGFLRAMGKTPPPLDLIAFVRGVN